MSANYAHADFVFFSQRQIASPEHHPESGNHFSVAREKQRIPSGKKSRDPTFRSSRALNKLLPTQSCRSARGQGQLVLGIAKHHP